MGITVSNPLKPLLFVVVLSSLMYLYMREKLSLRVGDVLTQ